MFGIGGDEAIRNVNGYVEEPVERDSKAITVPLLQER
jgi:hypothetical protein